MFAAPFIGQMGKGHVDGVYSLASDANSLQRFASGSGDGFVKVWDLTTREEVWQNQAHEGIVKGLAWSKNDQKLITCASDKTCKVFDPYNTSSGSLPSATYLGNIGFTSISLHRSLPNFAVSSNKISIYDLSRTSGNAVQELQWPTADNTIQQAAFNQTETSIIASCGTDRSVSISASSPVSLRMMKEFADFVVGMKILPVLI